MPKLPQPPRPPRLRTFTAKPTGSRTYRYGQAPKLVGGPGDPPPGFVIGTTSLSEHYVYWALARVYGNPPNPRLPPFIGGLPDWEYQSMSFGGRNLGGAVPDFVVYTTPRLRPLVLRLQTERYHIAVDTAHQSREVLQRASLERSADVIDLYEVEFISDPSGQAVMKAVKQALGRIEGTNTVTSGTFTRIR